jgi:hypothetical protein
MYKFPVDEPREHVEPGTVQSLEVRHTKRCMEPHAVALTQTVPMGLEVPLAPQQICPAPQSCGPKHAIAD